MMNSVTAGGGPRASHEDRKTLDLSVVLARPFEGGGGQEYAARLQYFDPTLFDSRKYFFTAGAFYTQAALRFTSPSGLLAGTGNYRNSGAGVDFSVGLHLDTYSYVTIGYRYLQNTAGDREEDRDRARR
jgi:outer membrane protein assembly factor BamA